MITAKKKLAAIDWERWEDVLKEANQLLVDGADPSQVWGSRDETLGDIIKQCEWWINESKKNRRTE